MGDIACVKWSFLAHLTKSNTIPVTVHQHSEIFSWSYEIGMISKLTTVFATAQRHSHAASTQLPRYAERAGARIRSLRPPSPQGRLGRWRRLLGGTGEAPSTALGLPSSPTIRNTTRGNGAVVRQAESWLVQSCSCTFPSPSLHSEINPPWKWHYRSPLSPQLRGL